MSAILSADDLNDFINPGVACIKPVETLPKQQPLDDGTNPYEVTTEEKVNSGTIAPAAQISLTDCLACSGCVTSAEAVLVSLQSHGEVLDTLNKFRELPLPTAVHAPAQGIAENHHLRDVGGKIFIASVSPQARASLAATYGVTEGEAANMITQLLSGSSGLRSGGQHGSGFQWVVDTNAMREASLVAAADEVEISLNPAAEGPKRPVITSSCPGWICYAEKTHPHILPHLSSLKSPQALTGVLLKSVLARAFGVHPQQVWHLAIMPCFDKKLEASRSELTSHTWHDEDGDSVRDVDCVITARELLMLAESRNISFPRMPKEAIVQTFPDAIINDYLFGHQHGVRRGPEEANIVGTSGGYLYHILKTRQAQHLGSSISFQQGRNNDVSEFTLNDSQGNEVFKAARYYGFRNIQNLVRRLKPARASRMPGAVARRPGNGRKPQGAQTEGDYAYIEVMACPGGCTNGGGQIKIGDVATLRQIGRTGIENGSIDQDMLPAQRDWLASVDEAYWSAEEPDDETKQKKIPPEADSSGDIHMGGTASPAHDSVYSNNSEMVWDAESSIVDGINRRYVKNMLHHWSSITGVELRTLLTTTYRVVESDVGKDKKTVDVEKVAALAQAAGGGW